jgi:lysyl-tRNA synthetase class 2
VTDPIHSWRPSATRAALAARARLLSQTRTFFADRDVLEVDVPVLQGGANLDRAIEPMNLATSAGRRYLTTSPEHPLKRLVAAGYGDVWHLGPAFRADEIGRRHAPEFRMLEWYRVGFDLAHLIAETIELLATLTGLDGTSECLSYRAAFARHLGLDPFTATNEELATHLPGDLTPPPNRQDLLDALMGLVIQEQLPATTWTIITDWPPEQAAQARLSQDNHGTTVARRFEIYRGSLELANGYDECTDAGDLTTRLSNERAQRATAPELDRHFLAALDHGLPACTGVAVGFDRVCMLALGCADISATQAFAWDRA